MNRVEVYFITMTSRRIF